MIEVGPQASLDPMALTERDKAILDFERTWWTEAGPKDTAIRERFELSGTRYYQLLTELHRRRRGARVRPAPHPAPAPRPRAASPRPRRGAPDEPARPAIGETRPMARRRPAEPTVNPARGAALVVVAVRDRAVPAPRGARHLRGGHHQPERPGLRLLRLGRLDPTAPTRATGTTTTTVATRPPGEVPTIVLNDSGVGRRRGQLQRRARRGWLPAHQPRRRQRRRRGRRGHHDHLLRARVRGRGGRGRRRHRRAGHRRARPRCPPPRRARSPAPAWWSSSAPTSPTSRPPRRRATTTTTTTAAT